MKNTLHHLKTSSIMSGSGMISFTGGQYITSTVPDNLWKTLALFLFMTIMGVASKLVLDRLVVKRDS